MSALSIKNLSKTYQNGVTALKNVNLEVEEGDFFALLGANGAGKTTMIGIVTGLVNKTEGSVSVLGFDLDTQTVQVRQQIGLVPQEFNFGIFEKVIDIVVNQAGYFGISFENAKIEAKKVLKQLELWEKRNEPARNLSGGMKRRLMIARALIHKPKLLILDEPTAGVDIELRRGMWEYLQELNANGTTIILTTHYLEEAEQLCKNVAIIKQGQIVKHDKMKTVLQSLDKEAFIFDVADSESAKEIKNFKVTIIDSNSIEVEITKQQNLNDFIKALTEKNIIITSMRPKGNRLEELFLNIVNN